MQVIYTASKLRNQDSNTGSLNIELHNCNYNTIAMPYYRAVSITQTGMGVERISRKELY